MTPDQIAEAPGHQQEAGEGDGVGVHDPLQARGREVQPALNRGKRHVHDRVIEDDHELGDAHDDEDEPGVDALWLHVFVLCLQYNRSVGSGYGVLYGTMVPFVKDF